MTPLADNKWTYCPSVHLLGSSRPPRRSLRSAMLLLLGVRVTPACLSFAPRSLCLDILTILRHLMPPLSLPRRLTLPLIHYSDSPHSLLHRLHPLSPTPPLTPPPNLIPYGSKFHAASKSPWHTRRYLEGEFWEVERGRRGLRGFQMNTPLISFKPDSFFQGIIHRVGKSTGLKLYTTQRGYL